MLEHWRLRSWFGWSSRSETMIPRRPKWFRLIELVRSGIARRVGLGRADWVMSPARGGRSRYGRHWRRSGGDRNRAIRQEPSRPDQVVSDSQERSHSVLVAAKA